MDIGPKSQSELEQRKVGNKSLITVPQSLYGKGGKDPEVARLSTVVSRLPRD